VDEDKDDNDDADADEDDEEEGEDEDVKADGDECYFPPDDELDDAPMAEADPPVSNGVTDDVDDADGDAEETSEEGGGVGVEEMKDKKTNAFDTKWVKKYADLVHYYNANGDCHVVPKYITAEGNSLGN
jgi:hypothetical protein